MIPEVFEYIKTKLVAMFDERYVVVTDVVAVAAVINAFGQHRARSVTYSEFCTTHPPNFYGGMDPIISMRWIIDVESAFRLCLCLEVLKAKFALNLLLSKGRIGGVWFPRPFLLMRVRL